jgi:alkaline phosphatase D
MSLTRRETLAGAAALAASACASAPEQQKSSDAHSASSRALSRIAFGSCAKQDKEQPIWEAILNAKPDLFIFLGDNIYADTRDPKVMAEKYAMLAAKPGFRRLRETTPICAIWDDHDYGEDDAGADYPMKEESRRQFCDFWGEGADSVRRTRDGIYAAHVFGPTGRRVQVILPDLRWNRTPMRKLDLGGKSYTAWQAEQKTAGLPVPGPYERNPALEATMLGERQWTWLEEQLAQPADVRVLASSLQVLADFAGWEGWINFARDHQRLISAIRQTKANGLVCISGDTHYAELSMLDLNTPYPVWDLTSSGLTEVWPVLPPNALRVGEALRENNFGLIDIDWSTRHLSLQACDVSGAVKIAHRVALATLKVDEGLSR